MGACKIMVSDIFKKVQNEELKKYPKQKKKLANTKIIYIYPSPETVGKILFKDKADNCFSFEEEEIECPSDESAISSIPMQS